jgi:putative restriction endonuclease
MSERHAWSLLTIEGARQYGGNEGYDDDPSSTYRYDSDVGNHLQVQAGDIAILRSRNSVLGIAEISEITESGGHKQRLRCPTCSIINIKRRLTMEPAWGCKNGHSFDEPLSETVPVTKFEAHYGASFRPCGPELTPSRLHEAVLRPSDQMSIKEIDLARIEPWIQSTAADLLVKYAGDLTVSAEKPADGAEEQGSIIEERRRILREISVRRGQARFRSRLIRRYGAACQISRCD